MKAFCIFSLTLLIEASLSSNVTERQSYKSLLTQITVKSYTETSRLTHAYFTIPEYTLQSVLEISVLINPRKIDTCQPSNVYLSFQHGSLAYVNPYSNNEGPEFKLNRPHFFQLNFTENTTETHRKHVMEYPRFGTWYVSAYSLIPGKSTSNLCVMYVIILMKAVLIPLSGSLPSPTVVNMETQLSTSIDSQEELLFSVSPQPYIRDLQFEIISSSSVCPVFISAGIERISDEERMMDNSCRINVTALQGASSQVYLYIFRNGSESRLDIQIKTRILTACTSQNVTEEMDRDQMSCHLIAPLNYVDYLDDFSFSFVNYLNPIVIGSTILLGFNTVVVMPMYIRPHVNQGGTVRFRVTLFPSNLLVKKNDKLEQYELLSRNISLFVCVSQSLPTLDGVLKSGQPANNFAQWNRTCTVFMQLAMNAPNNRTTSEYLMPEDQPLYQKPTSQEYFVPYPSEGMWYMSVVAFCQSDAYKAYCSPTLPSQYSSTILINILSQSCVEKSCLNGGTCKSQKQRSIYFSRCDCTNGYDGINCQIPFGAFHPWLDIFFLTISNIFFLPSIFISLKRRLFVPFCAYTYTMIISIMYHACDTGYTTSTCVFKSDALSFSDFYGAVMSLWITVICMTMLPPVLTNVLYVSMALVIVIGVNLSRHSVTLYALPLGIGAFFLLISWSLWMISRRRVFPPKLYYLRQFLPASCLAITGVVLFATETTKSSYSLIHSFWHASIAIAIALYLPSPNIWLKQYIHQVDQVELADPESQDPPKKLTEAEVIKEALMIVKMKLMTLFRKSAARPVHHNISPNIEVHPPQYPVVTPSGDDTNTVLIVDTLVTSSVSLPCFNNDGKDLHHRNTSI